MTAVSVVGFFMIEAPLRTFSHRICVQRESQWYERFCFCFCFCFLLPTPPFPLSASEGLIHFDLADVAADYEDPQIVAVLIEWEHEKPKFL